MLAEIFDQMGHYELFKKTPLLVKFWIVFHSPVSSQFAQRLHGLLQFCWWGPLGYIIISNSVGWHVVKQFKFTYCDNSYDTYDYYTTFITYVLFYNLLKVCGVLVTYCHCVHVGNTSRGHWFTQYVPLMKIGSCICWHPVLCMTLIQQSYFQ
jgi:hypothetical protein